MRGGDFDLHERDSLATSVQVADLPRPPAASRTSLSLRSATPLNGILWFPDKLGHDITGRNNFARGTGDDGFAVYSDGGPSGASAQVARVKIINNTSVATW